jgi:hypothetical protein
LIDYSKQTGIDLSKYPIADVFEQSNSPEAILQLFQQRERAFKEYREGNPRLINCLSPAVNVLQAFSGILGGVASLVSQSYIPSGDSLNVASSGPLPTNKRIVGRD